MNVALKNEVPSGKALVQKVRNGDKQAFRTLFFRHYEDLCRLAAQVTKSTDSARDVVQEVFLRLWRNRKSWQINSSLKAYLLQAVWNEALNTRKKQKNRRNLIRKVTRQTNQIRETVKNRSGKESQKLVREIWQIVSEMPERRRNVFSLHRKHGLSYREIGQVMGVSRKTVENHMGLALKEIREKLDSSFVD